MKPSIPIAQEAVIWSIFVACVIEMAAIFLYTMRDLTNTTQSQFVHKDKLIVYFVTFLITGLFTKLLIATASQWDFNDRAEMTAQELTCQLFVNDHVPQVFLVLAIMVVYFKTGLYQGALYENNA